MFEMRKEKTKISIKTSISLCLMVLLTCSWVLAAQAQNPTGEKHSAHIKRDPSADDSRFIVEHEIPTKMQIPSIQFNACEAFITIQYHQRNTLARVESTVEHESCTASKGEFELLVNILDENGVSRNLSFHESWEQTDDSLLKLSKDYPIGENVTLKRVITQRIRCECEDL